MAEIEEAKIELTNEYLKKALDEVIKRKGFVKYDLDISPGSKKGDNYAGIVYKVGVSGVKETGEKASLFLFTKIPHKLEAEQDIGMNEGFVRENKFYDEILKEMKDFESDKTMEDEFTSYAECLATGSINRNEFLILEDISKKNFVMFDRMKKLDLDHTQLVMKALGKFHAYSFAIRDQKPELHKKYPVEVSEIFMKEEMLPPLVAFMESFLKSAVDKLHFEGIYQEKWEYFYKNYYRIMKDCCKWELAEPYAVVNHGDCWNNNMMFKYENGKPIEVCLLDWQVSRYASPALDLLYYIFTCTEKSFRDEHYETLLEIYHKTFSSFLRQLGSDPDILFPYSAFKDQIKKFGKWGLGMAIALVPLLATNEEDARSLADMMGDASSTLDNEKTIKIWTTRLSNVLIDMVDLGYL